MKVKVKNFFKYVFAHRAAYLMVAPLIIGVLAFCYYPPVYGIVLSFMDKSGKKFVGFQNYALLFSDKEFWSYFGIMAKIQIPRLVAGVFVPLVYAELVFHLRSTKAQGIYRILILLPAVAPGVVTNLVWKQIFSIDGLMNALLKGFGIVQPGAEIAFLEDARYVIFAILFMGFPWIGGSQVLIYLSGLLNIPKEILEAADLDGATTSQKIFKIHLSHLSGQIRYFLIFGFISGMQDYGTQVVLTEGGPAGATTVPGYYMFVLMERQEYGQASAVGGILFVMIGLVTIVLFNCVKFGDSKDD